MVMSNKLVASIKCGGKIMREQGDTVFLPFGKEYSILLKNLNTERALVHVEIDGEQVASGGIILNCNDTIDLERFILNGDLSKGPRFKFIEKTQEISDHRGDKIDDGIVKITYQYEVTRVMYSGPPSYYNMPLFRDGSMTGGQRATYGTMNFGSSVDGSNLIPKSVSFQSDAGITVKGSESGQKFSTGTIGLLEVEKHVIILNIRGQVGETPVVEPVTVGRKIQCDICGKQNSSSNKFCGQCGNNLTYQY